jgi:hypothetical protein
MIRFTLFLATALVAGQATAQTMYKCTVDGKISYSDTPCAKGAETKIAVDKAPPPDMEHARRLERQQEFIAGREEERRKQDLEDEAMRARDRRAAQAAQAVADRKAAQDRRKVYCANVQAELAQNRGPVDRNSQFAAARQRNVDALRQQAFDCSRN